MIDASVDGVYEHTYETMMRLETLTGYSGVLIEAWAKVLIEDNRRGVMQGQQGDGSPMKPTKYRLSLNQTAGGKAGDTFFNASGQALGNAQMAFAGPYLGSYLSNLSGSSGAGSKPGPSHNLKTREYVKMTGPPLAPRGPASRVISNYKINILTGKNRVGVEGGWDDVVSKKGVSFLPAHFRGATFPVEKNNVGKTGFAQSFFIIELPQRNLVGLRQWGKSQATRELNAWIKWLLTFSQPEYFGSSRAGHTPKYVRRKR